jgi:hypothetical protein
MKTQGTLPSHILSTVHDCTGQHLTSFEIFVRATFGVGAEHYLVHNHHKNSKLQTSFT